MPEGIPPLTAGEASSYHEQAPEWTLLSDSREIERTFWFANSREALTFVQRVGELAEPEHHHPDAAFGWEHATVSLETKNIKGLHENDFIMAVKIDRLRLKPQRRHASDKQEIVGVSVTRLRTNRREAISRPRGCVWRGRLCAHESRVTASDTQRVTW